MKKGVLEVFTKLTGKHLCQSLFFNKVAGLRHLRWSIFLVTPAQVFLCDYCEIFKTSFFYRTSPIAASNGASAIDNFQHDQKQLFKVVL